MQRAVPIAAVMQASITSFALLGGSPAGAQPVEAATPAITVGGYVEVYYQVDAQDPSNRLTNLRGFDNRSRTFTLSNVALDGKGETGPLTVHVIVQWGHTPSTYYLAEPVSRGTTSVDTSDGELWKYIQTATVSAKKADFVIEAGVVPSPIGVEVFAIKDNWNWSRSNLFFGLPFYHTGVTVSHPLGGDWIGKLHVYNGWNSVVDNNGYPSVGVSASYHADSTIAQVLYFGGIERPDGAPEGKPWRSLFDAYVTFAASDELDLGAHADAGFEPNRIGTSWWAAGALYARLAVTSELYAAVRGDYFREHRADDAVLSAGALFWPVSWVTEATATLAYQPIDHASIRLEYRHDHAADEAYFGGDVVLDPVAMTAIPNRTMQDTVTLGVTAWF